MTSRAVHNEKELLLLVAGGDEKAFRHIYDLHHQKLYAFAFFLTRSADLAEDITQDIFLKIWIHRLELSEISNFNAWLKTLIRNQAITHLRRLSHERLILRKVGETAGQTASVTETDVADREYARLLEQAIFQLHPQQKKVYLLSRQQGMKHEEIAATMGLSVNTVKNHMKAALQSVRAYLDLHTDALVLLAIAIFFRE